MLFIRTDFWHILELSTFVTRDSNHNNSKITGINAIH